MSVHVTVRTDAPIGTISPRLYGHFAEHIGRCCYDGLWVGTDCDTVRHEEGFRSDVVAALCAMPTPLLRWPGGCYADHYHWRDGIGPSAQRPRRLGMSCGLTVEDDNGLGTHEFLRLCALIGAEPYLAGNVGSGTPQELCDWLEYCNSALDTTLTRERATNGASDPFNVRLWGVGNENWGCGGNFDAAGYAREYRRYATLLQHVDPTAELVACGFDDAWNETLLKTLQGHLSLIDHLSIHCYWTQGGPEIDFTDADYYALLAEAGRTEDFVRRTSALIEAATGGRRTIGIALDEWGVWHPEARAWGDRAVPRDPTTYEQEGTLRDALAVGVALEGFHRQCRALSMANIAQVVNILHAPVMTRGDRMWLTPTYHAFRLHAPHIGATALPVEITTAETLPDGSPAVTGTASRNGNGLAVTLINRHLSQPAAVEIAGITGFSTGSCNLLTAASPRAANSATAPDHVTPIAGPLAETAGGWGLELPPHSMATLQMS